MSKIICNHAGLKFLVIRLPFVPLPSFMHRCRGVYPLYIPADLLKKYRNNDKNGNKSK